MLNTMSECAIPFQGVATRGDAEVGQYAITQISEFQIRFHHRAL